MTTRPSGLQTDLAAVLAADLRALVASLKRRLREQATQGDFTPSQVAVLLRLERGGAATVSNLARAEGVRSQSMGTLLTPLEAAGLIAGQPDPSDGRQTLWSLTDACRASMTQMRAARQDWLSHSIAAKLSAEEQQQLATAIDLLKRIAND